MTSYRYLTSEFELEAVNEQALLLSWPEKICPQQHQLIVELQAKINANLAELIVDSIAAYNSLMVYYSAELTDSEFIQSQIISLVKEENNDADSTTCADSEIASNHAETIIEIPVYYGALDGSHPCDLAQVAEQTKLSSEQVIHTHCSTTYHAFALGFTPGFCYLGSLPKALQLPRKATPRLSVPKGAVAIAEQQTAVYPNKSPGGWHILGYTPLDMYQVASDEETQGEHNPSERNLSENNTTENRHSFKPKVLPGQKVTFKAISLSEFQQLSAQYPAQLSHQENNAHSKAARKQDHQAANTEQAVLSQTEFSQTVLTRAILTIEELKGFCSFQDLGRAPNQHLGFSGTGASDEFAYLWGNKLLGNEPNAPALEVIFGQMTLKTNANCTVALTGANCQPAINGQAVSMWKVLPLKAGDVLTLNQVSKGLLTYLTIKKGFHCKKWLGSASQNGNEVSLGFGESKISQGQQLYVCAESQAGSKASSCSTAPLGETSVANLQYRPSWQHFYQGQLSNENLSNSSASLKLRFIPSKLFLSLPKIQAQKLLSQVFTISANSNKMGYRLASDHPIELNEPVANLSKPVCFGTIQLPSNGQPIILMKDRQTIGGYPVLGTVIQVDLFKLAQKRPGEKVSFASTSIKFAELQLKSLYQRLK